MEALMSDGNVVLEKFALVFDDRDPMILDLTQPDEAVDKTNFHLKEGVAYKMELTFRIKEKIAKGLKYFHAVTRKGVNVDKVSIMVGSFGPRDEPHVHVMSEQQEAPKGMLYRGHYEVASKLFDDDKIVHKQFKWGFDINRSWE